MFGIFFSAVRGVLVTISLSLLVQVIPPAALGSWPAARLLAALPAGAFRWVEPPPGPMTRERTEKQTEGREGTSFLADTRMPHGLLGPLRETFVGDA